MSDGLGNAVGGLLGLAILAGVAGNIINNNQRRRPLSRPKMKMKMKKPKKIKFIM